MSLDELVREYRLSYPEAETLGPSLLTYAEVVKALGIRRILVPKIHLRSALEIEMATRSLWTGDFDAVLEMTLNSEIRDAMTIVAVLRAARLLGR